MQQYTNDYTLVSEAESHLHAAQQLEAHEQPEEAWKHIQDAREKLQQYLSKDNMVKDGDVAYGWIKAKDIFDDEQLDHIRDLFGECISKNPESPLATDCLNIINVCQRQLGCPEFDSVWQFLNNTSGKWTEIFNKPKPQ